MKTFKLKWKQYKILTVKWKPFYAKIWNINNKHWYVIRVIWISDKWKLITKNVNIKFNRDKLISNKFFRSIKEIGKKAFNLQFTS